MMPALHMRTSRREDWEVNCLAAFSTEWREARLHSRNETLTLGSSAFISLMREVAFFESRPLK